MCTTRANTNQPLCTRDKLSLTYLQQTDSPSKENTHLNVIPETDTVQPWISEAALRYISLNPQRERENSCERIVYLIPMARKTKIQTITIQFSKLFDIV